MKRAPRTLRRISCVLAYLLPLLLGIGMLVYACIPHLWFVYDHEAYETLSLNGLLENARKACRQSLESSDESAVGTQSFAHAVMASSIACRVGAVLYLFVAVFAAACAIFAFCFPPTHRHACFAKRLLRFVCPNRICLLLSYLWALLPALFPPVLVLCYRQLQGLSMRVYYFPVADWVFALICIALCAALYILTLPWQAEEHLDMFRIYRSKDAVRRAGDEVI